MTVDLDAVRKLEEQLREDDGEMSPDWTVDGYDTHHDACAAIVRTRNALPVIADTLRDLCAEVERLRATPEARIDSVTMKLADLCAQATTMLAAERDAARARVAELEASQADAARLSIGAIEASSVLALTKLAREEGGGAVKVTPEMITDEVVLAAMDPNGATMKYGPICTQVETDTGIGPYDTYRAVARVLQRMRRAGRVELIKGPGAGWRIAGLSRPRVGAINARANGGDRG